jgi:transcriptional regulator with XRE-family HTH domain
MKSTPGKPQIRVGGQTPRMDDMRLGSVIKALRDRRGWTQVQLASAARLSPAAISRLEHGRIDATTLVVLRRVFNAMDAPIDLVPRWRGGDLDRLIDARHAGMVETLVRRLASLPEWIVQPEVTFSFFGERGSIDVIAWHPGRRALLIIEVKSAIGDVGGLVRQVDRYRRLARDIARDRDWSPAFVGVWVVVADGRTARRRFAEHETTLRQAFPADGHAMEGWIHRPERDLSGLSFLPIAHPMKVGRRGRAAA